jgi:hypothetical protein
MYVRKQIYSSYTLIHKFSCMQVLAMLTFNGIVMGGRVLR